MRTHSQGSQAFDVRSMDTGGAIKAALPLGVRENL